MQVQCVGAPFGGPKWLGPINCFGLNAPIGAKFVLRTYGGLTRRFKLADIKFSRGRGNSRFDLS
jgi:hypothetical protein